MGHASFHPHGKEICVSAGATVSSAQYTLYAQSHTALNTVRRQLILGFESPLLLNVRINFLKQLPKLC